MTVILRARFVASLVASSHQCLVQTFWRPGTGGGSTADATDILARVRANLNANITRYVTGFTFIPQGEVDAIEDTTGAITGAFFGALPANVVGTQVGDTLPLQNAWLVQSRTNLVSHGRILKGRTFLPGASEVGNTSLGGPSSGDVTAINAAFTGMLTGGTTASFPVVWSRPTATRLGTSGAVVGYQTQANYWGTQRRRRFV